MSLKIQMHLREYGLYVRESLKIELNTTLS